MIVIILAGTYNTGKTKTLKTLATEIKNKMSGSETDKTEKNNDVDYCIDIKGCAIRADVYNDDSQCDYKQGVRVCITTDGDTEASMRGNIYEYVAKYHPHIWITPCHLRGDAYTLLNTYIYEEELNNIPLVYRVGKTRIEHDQMCNDKNKGKSARDISAYKDNNPLYIQANETDANRLLDIIKDLLVKL